MNQIRLLALLLAVLLPLGVAQAQMYKWTDKNGNTVYSQSPPPTGNYKTMSVPTPPAGNATTSDQNAQTDQSSNSGDSPANKTIEKLSKKSAEVRQKNCAAAKRNLQIYQVYRRIKQKDGSVIRLSDNERQQKINQAKQAIKEFCN